MVRRASGGPAPDESIPRGEDFPNVPPRDLHATSDIRFVMIEMGKLITKVDRLIDDVRKLDGRVDDLRHAVTWAKGFGIAAIILIPACAALVWWLVGGELTQIRDRIYSVPPISQPPVPLQGTRSP